MALQPAGQTAMYNNRRRNAAQQLPGSTTTAPVRPTEGALGPGKDPYGEKARAGRTTTQPTAQPQSQPAPWTPYSAPGYGEDWWNSHKSQWDQPGQASN